MVSKQDPETERTTHKSVDHGYQVGIVQGAGGIGQDLGGWTLSLKSHLYKKTKEYYGRLAVSIAIVAVVKRADQAAGPWKAKF